MTADIALVSDVEIISGLQTGAGTAIYTYELAKSLATLKHNVLVFSPTTKLKPPESEIYNGVRIRYLQNFKKGSPFFKTNFFYIRDVAKEIQRQINKSAIDLILFNGITGLFSYFNYQLPNIHACSIVHGVLNAVPCRIKEIFEINQSSITHFNKFIKSYVVNRTAEKICYKLSPRINAVSKSVKDDLVAYYRVKSSKISVVYNGVNHEMFNLKDFCAEYIKNKLNLNKFVILYVGRLNFHKGVFHLIFAFKKIIDKLKNVSLVIIGDYDSYSYYRLNQIIRNFELGKQIQIMGPIPYFDLPKYYFISDVVVVPSFYEGFGMSALEAMAAGKPIVASNIGGLPEIVNDRTGILVNPGDINQIAESVVKLLKEENLKLEMGNRAMICARNFSWLKTAKLITRGL